MTIGSKSSLVTSDSTPNVLTGNQEADCRTALTRGVADYLRTLAIQMPGGRKLLFEEVLNTWAEPEVPAKYPSAIVYAAGPGTYDASRFAPGINSKDKLPEPDGRYVLQLAEFTLDLSVELWATDPNERVGLVKMLEDAFNPVDWMYGFRLDLPHYYGARASYEMKSLVYMEAEDDAARRYRRAAFTLGGRVPLIRMVDFPQAKPRARLDVIESIVEVGESTEVTS